jgi:hypothetical protein
VVLTPGIRPGLMPGVTRAKGLLPGGTQQWTPVKQGGDDYQNMACVMHSSLYVLELEDGCYYVGLATAGCGVEQRISMTSPRHDWPRKFNADGASSIQPDQIAQRSP